MMDRDAVRVQMDRCGLRNLEIMLREIVQDPVYIGIVEQRALDMAEDMVYKDQLREGFSDEQAEARVPFVMTRLLHHEYAELYADQLQTLYEDDKTLWYVELEEVFRSFDRPKQSYEYQEGDITYIIDRPQEPSGKMLTLRELWEGIKEDVDRDTARFVNDMVKRKTNSLAKRLGISSSEEYFELHRDVKSEILGRFRVGLDSGRYKNGYKLDFVPTDDWFHQQLQDKYERYDEDGGDWI